MSSPTLNMIERRNAAWQSGCSAEAAALGKQINSAAKWDSRE